MDMQKEREAFEEYITDTGLVEFAGYGFSVDECDEYLHEPTNVAWQAWVEGLRRAAKASAASEIEELKSQLDTEKSLRNMSEHLNKVKQDIIEELKASAVPETLEVDAQVGGAIFRKGVKTRTVIEAAQRHRKYILECKEDKPVIELSDAVKLVSGEYILMPKQPNYEMLCSVAYAACGGTALNIYEAIIKKAQEQCHDS